MRIATYVNAYLELEASIAHIFMVFIRLALQEDAKFLSLLNVQFVNDATNRNAAATIM